VLENIGNVRYKFCSQNFHKLISYEFSVTVINHTELNLNCIGYKQYDKLHSHNNNNNNNNNNPP